MIINCDESLIFRKSMITAFPCICQSKTTSCMVSYSLLLSSSQNLIIHSTLHLKRGEWQKMELICSNTFLWGLFVHWTFTLLCLKSGNYIWKSYHIKLSFIVLLFWLTLQCNKKRIIDYPNIWGYLRDLYQTSGIGETVDAEHIQKHYQVGDIPFLPFFFFFRLWIKRMQNNRTLVSAVLWS